MTIGWHIRSNVFFDHVFKFICLFASSIVALILSENERLHVVSKRLRYQLMGPFVEYKTSISLTLNLRSMLALWLLSLAASKGVICKRKKWKRWFLLKY